MCWLRGMQTRGASWNYLDIVNLNMIVIIVQLFVNIRYRFALLILSSPLGYIQVHESLSGAIILKRYRFCFLSEYIICVQ